MVSAKKQHSAIAIVCALLAATLLAERAVRAELPLRLTEGTSDIVADLKHYVPERMRESNVPGVAIALVRDRQIVWNGGFGTTRIWAGEDVTEETVFQVASNSKVVNAYIALRLVEDGRLTLDDPVLSVLNEPWLPRSAFGKRITVRHLASHTSGLTDRLLPLDKRVVSDPGTEFRYAGVGALYLQEVVEQVTGQSLEKVAREVVFGPLGMSSSSFVNSRDLRPRTASGHKRYLPDLLLFLVPWAATFLGLCALALPVTRWRTKNWLPRAGVWSGLAIGAVLAAFAFDVYVLGWALPNVVLLSFGCAAAFAVVLGGAVWVGRQVAKGSAAILATWTLVSVLALLFVAARIEGPIPRLLSPAPSAVGSLRASAPDLAAFLVELAQPRLLGEDMARALRTSQAAISEDYSWGLGPGIQHSSQGDALWQYGSTFGYRSLMVIYPDHGLGVVVLSNGEDLDAVCDIAGRAIGGKALWGSF